MTTDGNIKQDKHRHDLILAIERIRKSKVIALFLSDRPNATAIIAQDVVRPMYDHLRAMKRPGKLDLFLYSAGGHIDIPWRIVTMIRECAKEFAVLVPYRAMSAATLISLGADEIVLGEKAELGPIDPQVTIQRGQGEAIGQEELSVEDVMSYIDFLREKVGLNDESALSSLIMPLAEKLTPWSLGRIARTHSHIREVARKLLTSGRDKAEQDEVRTDTVIKKLAEETYQHGHAIGRSEAKDIGLPVVQPNAALENKMWELFEAYESLCNQREPIDARTFVPDGVNDHKQNITMGFLESVLLSDQFAADLRGERDRKSVPQIALNLNLNLQLPAGIDLNQLPQEAQNVLSQWLAQIQQAAQTLIPKEVNKLMPTTGFKLWVENGAWRRLADWPPSPPVKKQ